MKEKFLAQYLGFYKTLKSNFWYADGYTIKNSVEWKKSSFRAIREDLIQFNYEVGA